MHYSHPTSLIAVLLLSGFTCAQDLIYYKFESGGGRNVANYAPASPKAWRDGRLVGSMPDADIWGAGKFGSGALKGRKSSQTSAPYVNTGWDQSFTGDITIAFFFRIRSPFDVRSGSPVFGGGNQQPGIEAIIGRLQDSKGLIIYGLFGGVNREIILKKDLVTPAFSRWVHVAFTLNATTRVGQFFIDGTPEIPFTLSSTPFMPRAKWNFRVGKKGSHVDLDEFRLSLRTASAAEIKTWATRDMASQSTFTDGCGGIGNRGATLDSPTPPSLGNANHEFAIFGFPNSIYSLGIGTNRLKMGGLDLPYNLGALNPAWDGCLWRTSADIGWLPGTLDVGGRARLRLPIPNNTQFIGVTLYSQAYLLYAPTTMFMLSNSLASSIGH